MIFTQFAYATTLRSCSSNSEAAGSVPEKTTPETSILPCTSTPRTRAPVKVFLIQSRAPLSNSFAAGYSLSSKPDPSTQAAFRALLLLAILFATAWLLPSGVMAQATSPTPTLTPTPTPTATPAPALHVVMEEAPFWNSALGIFIVIVIAILAGFVIGFIARKGGTSPNGTRSTPTNGLVGLVGKLLDMFNDFTNVLAYVVVTFAFLGIFEIARQVIKVGGGDAAKALESAKFVFGAILPLLGTWVGAVLAHYFQKENLAAANQSISDLVKTVSTPGKLASLPVKDYMIGPGKIITLPVELQGMKDSEIPLRAIVDHLDLKQRDRLPLFADNKGSGAARCVIHLSKIQKFLAGKVLPPATISPPSAVAGGAQGGGTAGAGAVGGGAAGGGAAAGGAAGGGAAGGGAAGGGAAGGGAADGGAAGGGAAAGGAAGGGAAGGGAADGGAAGGGAAAGGAAGGGAAGGGAAPLTSIEQLAELTLGDLLGEPMDPLFKSSFSLVKESATLAEAKAAMDSMTSAPGGPGNCYDIFVTATGSATEPVLGWITNDIINQNANV